MNEKKATAVTVMFVVMLVAIDTGLYMLCPLGFVILTGVLALFGLLGLAVVFASWLAEKPVDNLEVPNVLHDDDLLPEDFTQTIESIMAEVEAQ